MPPKPRPRARPVVRQANSSESTAVNGGASASAKPAVKSARERELDADDAFFIRNRNLNWKTIDRNERDSSAVPATSSEPEGDDDSPPPRKRHKSTAVNKKKGAVPEWTKGGVIDLGSSSEDEKGRGKRVTRGNKARQGSADSHVDSNNKRSRSRSRSLTPPPQLSHAQVQNARLAVRRALATEAPRAASPTDNWEGEDSQDTIVLDPELAAIASKVRASQTLQAGRPAQGGGPDVVLLKVHWKPHPQDPEGEAETIAYKYNRRDNFNVLFNEIADGVGIPSVNLVVTFEGLRIFPSSTPDSLRIWAEAEMEACDKNTFQYLRENRNQRLPSSSGNDPNRRSDNAGANSDSKTELESAAEEDDDTFKLIVRSGTGVKDVTLTVRPATTCGAIVKAFLKRAGLADKYSEGKSRRKSTADGPRLVVDGERMNPDVPISDADLDDGDMVEIAGLS